MTGEQVDGAAYVVVGAGFAGAATAWQLAAAGHEVVVLEQGVPADPGGSSHGSARILRFAYADPFYVRLMVRAREVWDELEQAAGEQLVAPVGGLDFGATRAPEDTARVLEEAGVEHEVLGEAEAAVRAPGVRVEGRALWQPGAGVIDAERSVHAMLDLAQRHGARLLTGWEVARVDAGPALTATDGRVLRAGHVVVAAGGWLPHLLGRLDLPRAFTDGLPRLTVTEEQAFHFPWRDPAQAWPTTIQGLPGTEVYTLPGGRDAGFSGQKAAVFGAGRPRASARDRDGVVDADHRAQVAAYAREWLPGVEPTPYAETTCLFTSTPTEDFVLDRCGDVTVVSPCSGHGAKFAPLVGRLAAHAAAASGDEQAVGVVPDRFRVRR